MFVPPGIPMASLLADLPDDLPEERFETLLETPAFRLERILSQGHATPPRATGTIRIGTSG
jgi:hypothetical protein